MISKSILIVDDEKDLMSTLVRRLTRRGIRADGVSTGKAAISRLSEKRADVVVLNIILPDMKGLDLMMAIKKPDMTRS
nr:response regulator [Desulforegula conservatrix]